MRKMPAAANEIMVGTMACSGMAGLLNLRIWLPGPYLGKRPVYPGFCQVEQVSGLGTRW